MRLHEYGVLARFRYNHLKETARDSVACYLGFCWAIPTLFGLGSVQGKIYVCCSVDFNVYTIEVAGFVTPLPHCVECGLSQKGIAT